jgi:hypothetical protein
MHWWSPRSIAAALRSDTLSEHDKYRFTLAAVLLRGLIGSTAVIAAHATLGSLLSAILALLISGVGLHACYARNRAGDNRAFVERYMCLTAPLIAQLYLTYAALYYATLAIVALRSGATMQSAATSVIPYFWIGSLALVVVYFWQLRRFIGQAAGVQAI